MDKKQLLIDLAISFAGAFLAIGLYTALMGAPVVQAPPPQPMMPGQSQSPMPGQPNMQGRPPMPPQSGKSGAKPMPMPMPAPVKK